MDRTKQRELFYKRMLNRAPEFLLKRFVRNGLLDCAQILIVLSRAYNWKGVKSYQNELIQSEPYRSIFRQCAFVNGNDIHAQQEQVADAVARLISSQAFCSMKTNAISEASSVLNLFGFFRAAALLRLAVLARRVNPEPSQSDMQSEVARLELSMLSPSELRNIGGIGACDSYWRKIVTHNSAQSVETVVDSLRGLSRATFSEQEHRCLKNEVKSNCSLAKEFVDGKSILFVGPSARVAEENKPGPFDASVRIGYSGRNSLSARMDLKPDISFYKLHKLKYMQENGLLEILDGLKIGYVSSSGMPVEVPTSPNASICLSPFRGRILNGDDPNAGTEALLCLLGDGARKIYIENMDLFLNRKRPKGYIAFGARANESESGWEVEDLDFGRDLALVHNPVPQYAVFQAAWHSGKLAGDSQFARIMNEGLFSYLLRLEQEYDPLSALRSYAPKNELCG